MMQKIPELLAPTGVAAIIIDSGTILSSLIIFLPLNVWQRVLRRYHSFLVVQNIIFCSFTIYFLWQFILASTCYIFHIVLRQKNIKPFQTSENVGINRSQCAEGRFQFQLCFLSANLAVKLHELFDTPFIYIQIYRYLLLLYIQIDRFILAIFINLFSLY